MTSALRQRLVAVSGALGIEATASHSTDELLESVMAAAPDTSLDRVWLTFVALVGAFPSSDDLDEFRRAIATTEPSRRLSAVLDSVDVSDPRFHYAEREIRLVTRPALVDVAFCATYDHNTGIQRVVRSVMPRWMSAGLDLELVTWGPADEGYRELTDSERSRVLEWPDRSAQHSVEEIPTELVVPWHCALILPEVASYRQCAPLACIGECGVADIRMIGYDFIPVTSADAVPADESERFARYLTVVKHASQVSCISRSVAEEFHGFASAMGAQGIVGPEITADILAVDAPATDHARASSEPIVMCVGSHEPRKNQSAVLFAAEILYREGLRFRLVFVGGGSRACYAAFDRRVRRLRRRGVAVETHRQMPDQELWPLLASARFSVFVSLHEGFGLPAAESLALGVPVLTSNYGSLAEVAASGGCLTVDPRSDDQIIAGMRRLLSDDSLVHDLADQARSEEWRTWDEYSQDLAVAFHLGVSEPA